MDAGGLWMCGGTTSNSGTVRARGDLDEPLRISESGFSGLSREECWAASRVAVALGPPVQTHGAFVHSAGLSPAQSPAWTNTDLSHHLFSGKTTGNGLRAALRSSSLDS